MIKEHDTVMVVKECSVPVNTIGVVVHLHEGGGIELEVLIDGEPDVVTVHQDDVRNIDYLEDDGMSEEDRDMLKAMSEDYKRDELPMWLEINSIEELMKYKNLNVMEDAAHMSGHSLEDIIEDVLEVGLADCAPCYRRSMELVSKPEGEDQCVHPSKCFGDLYVTQTSTGFDGDTGYGDSYLHLMDDVWLKVPYTF